MEITVKVEIPETCPSANHWSEVLLMGKCAKCKKMWGLAN